MFSIKYLIPEPLKNLVQKLVEKWRIKTPKQKWQFIYNIGDFMCDLVGIRVFKDLKNYWYTASCGLGASVYFITVTYTMIYYFKQNAFLRGVQCLCLFGHAVTVFQM